MRRHWFRGARPRPLFLGVLTLCLALPVAAQDEYEDEYEEEYEDSGSDGAEDAAAAESDAPAPAPADEGDAPADKAGPKKDAPETIDTFLVGAIDREPKPGTPIIANKKFPMSLTLEISAMFDYSFSDRFLNHAGGHLSLGFHIFDWLAVEGFAGGLYPQELNITRTVRVQGYSRDSNEEPALSGLWQTFAFGGAGLQWAPFYGKLSFASDFQVAFQFFFFGGAAVEGIAKPSGINDGQNVNNRRDFYLGVVGGQTYNYAPRFSAYYGGGVRILPWKWVALRLEVRQLTGLNPGVENDQWNEFIDINNMPLLQAGISFLL